MPQPETFRIPKRRQHVPAARQRIRKVLADWGITGEVADSVVLSANELVTNSVTHCRVSYAQVEVTLALDGPVLMLEVSDPDSDRLPRPHTSGPEEEGGRGLALVAGLAEEWGHRQEPHRKCVWARFAVTATVAVAVTEGPGLEGTHVPAGL
jgi:anti-sigma regulatory factor (Ser/Thr protein kinase)